MLIKDLRIFLDLAKSLHFGRTSKHWHVSASSLTRLIQKLEDEVGEALFERDNRTVRLTPVGELFRAFAQDTTSAWETLSSRVQQQAGTLRGNLSVFCSVTASYYFLQELLDEFRAHYPQVEIQLHTGDTALTIERILSEHEDIGIAARPDRIPGNLMFKPIGTSPLVFIAATGGPLQTRVNHCLESGGLLPWGELPMVVSETGLGRSRVDDWFRNQGIKPRIYAQVTGNEAIVSMVRLGFGIGVVPQLVVEHSPMRGKVAVLPLKPALEPFLIGICTLRRKLGNPTIRAFWDLVPDPAVAEGVNPHSPPLQAL
ncbi:MAG: HTH-type transcriptional activator IlvY [Pseudohongiellaceae bacterium]